MTLSALVVLLACNGAATESDSNTPFDTGTDPGILVRPDAYLFPSRADASVNSASWAGQTFRQVLIDDMKSHLGGLTQRLNNGLTPSPGDIQGELLFYYAFDSASQGALPHLLMTSPDALQTTYDEISSAKDLQGKIAGNDPIGQHKDWSQDFEGWPGANHPDALVRSWIEQIDGQAVEWGLGRYPLDPSGQPVASVFVTARGQDLQQLLHKFLRGGVAYSQATDDYLDDDLPEKGLNSDHTQVVSGGYSELERSWDEAFGYFGASETYGGWTDDEMGDGVLDVDQDGAIDLLTEVAFGYSVNAAKRDLGAVVATDFTRDAWQGFYEGRLLLASTSGALNASEMTTLQGHRDRIVVAWEKTIASTLVHYLNLVVQDMDAAPADYAFEVHAKHWSELKGFALGLQFNPRSALSSADFLMLHDALGVAPVLRSASPEHQLAYRNGLLSVRDLLANRFAFDPSNMGDSDGQNGW